jgi:hypothetical protein
MVNPAPHTKFLTLPEARRGNDFTHHKTTPD